MEQEGRADPSILVAAGELWLQAGELDRAREAADAVESSGVDAETVRGYRRLCERLDRAGDEGERVPDPPRLVP
jgi:hypothetical protein